MQPLPPFVWAAASCCWPRAGIASAQSVSCGDIITDDVTLDADLHCSSGWIALEVAAPNVTIDLNGHTLSGTRDLFGISFYEANALQIINGTISGFGLGVNGTYSNGAQVRNIIFEDLGNAVSLNYGANAQIVANEFRHIDSVAVGFLALGDGDNHPAGHHYIAYNRFYDIDQGVHACGFGNSYNRIIGNRFLAIRSYGLQLESSRYNQIQDNVFVNIENTGIFLSGSELNEIHDNIMWQGEFGIAMTPQFGPCNTGPLIFPNVFGNDVSQNTFAGLETGLSLGMGGSLPLVKKNYIRYNRFLFGTTGIYFQSDAIDNFADRNRFWDITYPILDEGTNNTY